MSASRKGTREGLTRRETFRLSGVGLSGLALGGLAIGAGRAGADECSGTAPCYPTDLGADRYSYFEDLKQNHPFYPMDKGRQTPLAANEMRISFMGSQNPPPRRVQKMMSVFVEVGWDDQKHRPLDQFIFDCGSGVCTNYDAMGIGFSRMDKVFLAHLHGDHMADLTHIYCFGPSADRKSPLYVWGPSASGVKSPRAPRRLYADGTQAFCRNLREAARWHTESFSFQSTALLEPDVPSRQEWGLPCDPVPVGDDAPYDGYALIPIELDWQRVGGVAYQNGKTGVKITHFPVVHCRQGSIGYKLEWTHPRNGAYLSMIYTSDTRPETVSVEQAINTDPHGQARGVDVFIHEMVVPPEVWLMKMMGLPRPPQEGDPIYEEIWKPALDDVKRVEESSHTPQGAFGHLLTLIDPKPRLTIATHFPVSDDTVDCALRSVRAKVPDIGALGEKLTWSTDLMVVKVMPDHIEQMAAIVSDYEFGAIPRIGGDLAAPKYAGPTDQLDTRNVIEPGADTYCESGY